jgi:ribosomal protein S18 acetylase RimI-like enzyme
METDLPAVQVVNVEAFLAIHESFESILGTHLASLVFPDWPTSQRRELEELLESPDSAMFVAVVEAQIVGFAVVTFDHETKIGELQMIAVHPESRREGIGALLNATALSAMRDAGMRLAELETGGDPAHADARRSYERAGYSALPIVRYYKEL